MIIESNKSLNTFNSFGFSVTAEYFVSVASVSELHEAVSWSKKRNLPCLILGGGSNIVFTRNVEGLTIHMSIRGIRKRAGGRGHNILLQVGAGEHWHTLVKKTLGLHFYGLENLALIPGLAGATPIQNIGAYGVEVGDLLESVDVYDQRTGKAFTLPTADCQFGYRQSLFKTDQGADYVVTGINLALSTEDKPKVSYQALIDALHARDIESPTATQVFNEVCELRSSKLPDPEKLGNAGSFFKNPIIERHLLDRLIQQFPKIPHFPDGDQHWKVPAAWLIDQAGWKGHRFRQVGVHNAQALVLVNHGGGNGQQIAILADNIKRDILQRYGIQLEREPVLY